MIQNYPISSQYLNNKLLLAYENLVYLLGQNIPDQSYCSGLYERLEASGDLISTSPTGILTADTPAIINILKFDYFYKKQYGQIRN